MYGAQSSELYRKARDEVLSHRSTLALVSPHSELHGVSPQLGVSRIFVVYTPPPISFQFELKTKGMSKTVLLKDSLLCES